MVDWHKTQSYLLTIDRKRNILKGNVKEERQFMWSVYMGWTQLLFWEEKQLMFLFSCWSRLKTCFISSSSMNSIYNCSVSHFLMFQYIEIDWPHKWHFLTSLFRLCGQSSKWRSLFQHDRSRPADVLRVSGTLVPGRPDLCRDSLPVGVSLDCWLDDTCSTLSPDIT